MVVLMLSGPVLHHRKVVGDLGRLLVFVDGSRSMGLADREMPLVRKLAVLESLQMLAADGMDASLVRASVLVGGIARRAQDLDAAAVADEEGFHKEVAILQERLQEVRAALGRREQGALFEKELLQPMTALGRRPFQQISDRERALAELKTLGTVAVRWEGVLGEVFSKENQQGPQAATVARAVQRFDSLTRAQRMQALILRGGPESMMARLAGKHEVELYALEGSEASRVWKPDVKSSNPPQELPVAAGAFTDLATALRSVAGTEASQKTAVVLLSDGQHNDGPSPLELGAALGKRSVPVYSVGMGSEVRARDLAVVSVDGPATVFHQDRLRGTVTLKQDVPVGVPYKLTVREGERVLWEKKLQGDGAQVRKVPFDVSVADSAAAQLQAQAAGVQLSGVALQLEAVVSGLDGDQESANDSGSLRVRAVTQKRKILLVEGRPRWEGRYLRNLFERDEQWEINAVVAGATSEEEGFLRGAGPGKLPTSATEVNGYDLVILGDIPRRFFRGDQELEWFRDYVGQRGGALVLIDGARENLREYAQGPLGPLLPVEWKKGGARIEAGRWVAGERGGSVAAMLLAPERAQNAEVWGQLEGPRWVSSAAALPGAEALMDVTHAGGSSAAVVFRAFGAGKVLYHGFEESWRWRREVADQHHTRYWNQVANWLAELPFAVRDRFVSLDAGALVYRPGESAQVRVRLRDGEGKPVSEARIEAVLWKNGERVASIALSAEENQGGLFRGSTAGLEAGDYEVSIESPVIPAAENKARTGFRVAGRETGVLSLLNLNEELLRRVSVASGGRYLREEEAGVLEKLLEPLSEGKVIELDTALWQSYYWFFPLAILLGLEWYLRKRLGLL